MRWKHPRRGAVPPDHFIPLVEPTEVMWPLTLHVLDLAIRECARWRAEGHDVAVAVNVSRRRAARPAAARARSSGCSSEHGLPVEALEIEVTEGAVMRDADAAARVLRRLTELGIRVIAIDDFGTGYSSLARLHELPLDTLKIDQSFVMRMANEGDALDRHVDHRARPRARPEGHRRGRRGRRDDRPARRARAATTSRATG